MKKFELNFLLLELDANNKKQSIVVPSRAY
jgi:hypothetical protein